MCTNKNKYQRDYQRTYQGSKYREWRKSTIEKLGGRCVVCGITEGLEIDHIDSSTKLYNPSCLYSRRKEVIDSELEKCHLLCKKHHKLKTYLFKECKNNHSENNLIHGSGYMYIQKGCRCDACRVWRKLYRDSVVGYNDIVSFEQVQGVLRSGLFSRKNEIPHGTRAGYLKEKRLELEPCSLCRAANAAYISEFKKKKKAKNC